MSKTVYHYCSSDTFVSIISNNTLRMTNIKKSNDYTEVINCLNVFQDALKQACLRFKKKFPHDSIFAAFCENISYENLIEQAVLNDSLTYYATCFSEAGDLLSQWRGYAKDATGVALGFDTRYLLEMTDYRNMKFMAVEYNAYNVLEDLIYYIIKKFEHAQHELKIRGPSVYENAVSAVISSFVYNAVFYKNPAFSEEQEWRLVFYPFGNIRNLAIRHRVRDMSTNQLYYDRMLEFVNKEGTYGPFKRKTLQFGVNRDNILSYFDLDFSSIAPYFVKEIVLGPKNKMDDLDLRLFLLSKGYNPGNIKIVRSKATYQ